MRRQPWLVVSVLGLAGVLLLGSFPARAYLDQMQQREDLASRAAALAAANQRLVEEAEELSSDETIERLARERYHMVRPGEEAYAILPDGQTPPPAAATVVAGASRPASPGAPTTPVEPAGESWWSRAWATITSIF